MNSEKYVVTGGAGFIASHIAERLVHEGKRVTILDNFYTGKKENLAFMYSLSDEAKRRCEFIEGDIRDLELMKKITEGADYIIHHAAIISVSESVFDPKLTNEVNVGGTLNVLMAAKEAGVKRVVIASSSAIYNDQYELPHIEDRNIVPYSSPYAVTKYIDELYCTLYAKLYNLETVFLRYFNVYGPRQDPNGEYAAVIPKFITTLLKKERPTIFGDGKQTRDFIFVDDVVRANLLACEREGIAGEAFNIGQGNNTSIEDLLKTIEDILRIHVVPEYAEKRPGDVMYSIADISKAKHLMGFEPQTDIYAGLEKTIKWFKNTVF